MLGANKELKKSCKSPGCHGASGHLSRGDWDIAGGWCWRPPIRHAAGSPAQQQTEVQARAGAQPARTAPQAATHRRSVHHSAGAARLIVFVPPGSDVPVKQWWDVTSDYSLRDTKRQALVQGAAASLRMYTLIARNKTSLWNGGSARQAGGS